MKSLFGLLAALSLLVGFGLGAGAEEDGGKKIKPTKAAGEIVSVETVDEVTTLVLKVKARKKKGEEAPPPEEQSFTLNAETFITIDGAAGEITGLEAGKKAKVEAVEGVATKVTVGKAPKKKKAKKAKEPEVEEGGEAE